MARVVELLQLLVFPVYLSSRTAVNEERDEDGYPDRSVKGGDAQDVPPVGDPTPQYRIAVHHPPHVSADEDIDQCDHKRNSITEKEIWDLHFPQFSCVESEIEGQVDVHGHG